MLHRFGQSRAGDCDVGPQLWPNGNARWSTLASAVESIAASTSALLPGTMDPAVRTGSRPASRRDVRQAMRVETEMAPETFDPSPRSYPRSVSFVRRAGPITVAVGIADNFARIENWLLEEASTERQMIDLLVKLIRQMKAAGSSVDRLTLHIGTLHPQLVGFAWVWNTDDGFCDEVRVADAAVDSDAYRLNPLQRIVETGETIRRRPSEPSARAEFPIMIELAAAGMTDYAAIPLSSLDTRNVITITTKVAGGFAEAEIDCLIRLFKLFALHVQRHSELKISENALGAYLGYGAAAKVLEGAIKRGAGDSIRAVIWVSDYSCCVRRRRLPLAAGGHRPPRRCGLFWQRRRSGSPGFHGHRRRR